LIKLKSPHNEGFLVAKLARNRFHFFIVGFEFGVNVHLQRLLTGSKVSSNPRVIKKDETNIPQSRILIKNK
jgi:hypothetical protein